MKKLSVILFSVIIAMVASVTAFAASSPSGPVIDDKYDIVGKIDNDSYKGVTVTIDDTTSKVIDEDGKVRFDDITEGTHKIVFSKDTTTLDEITINIIEGTETKSEKVSDDVYNIHVKSGVSTIYIDFKATGDDVIISGASSVGNDSPDSPPTGDYSVYAICLGLMVAFAGILVSGYFKKRFN